MPHCLIEYASPLAELIDISELVNATHKGAIASGLFESKAIKTRAHGCDHFLVGEESSNLFVHITISIMPGRSDEQKKGLLTCVAEHLAPLTPKVQSLTIELRDINQQHYFKQLV
ncbi:5-carboxymethyl-2-hydroxymuconate Delta-isomerase [Shewanella sp.]|uniref:5-carboxymethyl-2-hydroxymuconate Delta-isomerase n=1 Tax=Shewanella sp. TaxID=50422 RepID=UPI001EB7D981|nr:5-carboxymethyl-2-hydroxymuconate Delta-isomerase [Shewanella sp.]NRB22526.1 5-carboxymethyl-2-hydroxymuconate Delta-isomerase [Shewanella sp.]